MTIGCRRIQLFLELGKALKAIGGRFVEGSEAKDECLDSSDAAGFGSAAEYLVSATVFHGTGSKGQLASAKVILSKSVDRCPHGCLPPLSLEIEQGRA